MDLLTTTGTWTDLTTDLVVANNTVYLDTFFSFDTHWVQVANRVRKRNNALKAFLGTNWGQQKEMLLLTYKAIGRSIENYAAHVWSINTSDTSIQCAQNEALRIITGSHKMSSIDHLHGETKCYRSKSTRIFPLRNIWYIV